ncbi:MAG: hypothetical protein QGI93_13855 [Planctomycetota bacterium]|jgi:hypothetical protein|nr:hypothetical protein [Planctomycetota bacterium]
MSGQRIDFMRCEGIAMKVGPLELQSRSVAVMDIGSLLPPDWPPVDGMISLETLREVPFTLDLAGGRIILETPQSLKVRVANMKSVPMRLSQVAGGASLDVFVMVPTQLGDAWMMLDTGNVDRVVLAPHTTHMLDLNLDADGVTKLPGQGGTPDRWELEEPIRVTGLPPVTTRIAVQEIIYDGNLGAAFVREFIFTFDIAQRKLWATPAAHMMRERSENQR